MFLPAFFLIKGSSKITQKRLLHKTSESYLILIILKYEHQTISLGRLKYGRWAATCSSSKCTAEIKKIFKVIKDVELFSECYTINTGQCTVALTLLCTALQPRSSALSANLETSLLPVNSSKVQ